MANFIHTYRRYGHLYAKLDPLGIYDKYSNINLRQFEEFVRPTDLGISLQDHISKFKFQRAPVLRASKSIEEL